MRRLLRRRRSGGGRSAGAVRGVYGLVGVLATIVDVVVGLVTLTIVLGIALVVLGANEDNALVGAVRDAADFLAAPFRDVFERDDLKEELAINWGIAVLVYFVVGRAVAALLRRGGPRP